MRLTLSISGEAGEPVTINFASTTKLSDDDKLRVAKAFLCAAFRVCPKDKDSDDRLHPAAIALATFANSFVSALLRTRAERERAEWWAAQQEQQDPIAVQGLH